MLLVHVHGGKFTMRPVCVFSHSSKLDQNSTRLFGKHKHILQMNFSVAKYRAIYQWIVLYWFMHLVLVVPTTNKCWPASLVEPWERFHEFAVPFPKTGVIFTSVPDLASYFRIRIRNLFVRSGIRLRIQIQIQILTSTSKKMKTRKTRKTLYLYDTRQ